MANCFAREFIPYGSRYFHRFWWRSAPRRQEPHDKRTGTMPAVRMWARKIRKRIHFQSGAFLLSPSAAIWRLRRCSRIAKDSTPIRQTVKRSSWSLRSSSATQHLGRGRIIGTEGAIELGGTDELGVIDRQYGGRDRGPFHRLFDSRRIGLENPVSLRTAPGENRDLASSTARRTPERKNRSAASAPLRRFRDSFKSGLKLFQGQPTALIWVVKLSPHSLGGGFAFQCFLA